MSASVPFWTPWAGCTPRPAPRDSLFTPEFTVLGMCLDLGQVELGHVTLSNKQGRIERIIDRSDRLPGDKHERRDHQA